MRCPASRAIYMASVRRTTARRTSSLRAALDQSPPSNSTQSAFDPALLRRHHWSPSQPGRHTKLEQEYLEDTISQCARRRHRSCSAVPSAAELTSRAQWCRRHRPPGTPRRPATSSTPGTGSASTPGSGAWAMERRDWLDGVGRSRKSPCAQTRLRSDRCGRLREADEYNVTYLRAPRSIVGRAKLARLTYGISSVDGEALNCVARTFGSGMHGPSWGGGTSLRVAGTVVLAHGRRRYVRARGAEHGCTRRGAMRAGKVTVC